MPKKKKKVLKKMVGRQISLFGTDIMKKTSQNQKQRFYQHTGSLLNWILFMFVLL